MHLKSCSVSYLLRTFRTSKLGQCEENKINFSLSFRLPITTVRNRNKNDIDSNGSDPKDGKLNLPTISFDEQTSNGSSSSYAHNSNGTANDSNKNRTIKAVTRYIDAQGKKAANLTKQQSQSMVNLSSNLSVEGEVEESCSGDDRRLTIDQTAQHRSHHHEKQANHATSAIRSIIESQYAVLQQENEPMQKTSLDVKKKKKQNKLKMNYLHQNNQDILLAAGQISPRAEGKGGCPFTVSGSHSVDHSACKSEHSKSHHGSVHDKKHKLAAQHQKLVSNLASEFSKQAAAVSKTEKAMNDYLNLNTSNNTSNSSTTSADGDLPGKLASTQNKLSSSQHQEAVADKENAQCESSLESNLERKSQFNCLPSRASTFQNDSSLTDDQISSQINQMRSLSIQAPDCPMERVQFYKWFSQIVRRGRKGIQNMDANKNFLNNGTHSKSAGFMELVYKQELRDLIWLEIKAWMDSRSTIEHDTYLCQQRKKIPKTLEKLLKFNVNYQVLNDKNYPDRSRSLEHTYFLKNNEYLKTSLLESEPVNRSSSDQPGEQPVEPKPALVEQFKLNENKLHRASCENVTMSGNEVNDLKSYIDQDTLAASVAIKLTMNESANIGEHPANKSERDHAIDSPNVEDDNCNCSETLSRLCQYCVDKETTALEQVNRILGEIDEIEQLYPCVKALAIDYPTYESEQFVSRIKSLYLYQNIIRDIREKTNLLAKLFHIHNREAAGWPNFHDHAAATVEPFSYNTSSDCTPEIFNIINRDNSHKKPATPASSNAKDDLYHGYSYKLNAPAMAPSPFPVKQVHFNLDNEEYSKANESANTTPTLNGNSLTVNTTPNCLDSPDANMHSIINLNGPQSAEENQTINPFFPRKVSIYRRFVDKALKHKGLRYIYHQLSHILRPLLYRVHAALKKPALLNFDASTTNYVQQPPPAAKLDNCDLCHNTATTPDGKLCECVKNESRNFGKQNPSASNPPDPTNSAIPEDYSNELSEFGVWSVSYQQMSLPTFHRPFFFLLRVTIDVIHECLILRLEQVSLLFRT